MRLSVSLRTCQQEAFQPFPNPSTYCDCTQTNATSFVSHGEGITQLFPVITHNPPALMGPGLW